jgi:hypothetical protein
LSEKNLEKILEFFCYGRKPQKRSVRNYFDDLWRVKSDFEKILRANANSFSARGGVEKFMEFEREIFYD